MPTIIKPPRLLYYLLAAITLWGCSDDGGNEDYSSQDYVEQARSYLDAGQVDPAIIELKNALQKDAGNAGARFLLGKVYLERGDVNSADKELGRAKELGHDDLALIPLFARLYLAQGKRDELLALEADGLGAEDQATLLASQGLAHASNGNADKATAFLQQALTKNPDSDYVMISQARLLMSGGDLISARAQLEAILTRDAAHADALMLIGDIEAAEGSLDGAEDAYGKSMEGALNPTEAQLKRALIRIQKQDFEAAQLDAAELIKRYPQNPSVNFVQGIILFQNHEFQEAISALVLAEREKQRYPQALLYAGISHYALGHHDQAMAYANQFHALAPDNIHGRRLLSTVNLASGDYLAAETAIRPVLDANPNDLPALNLLANAMLAQGNSEEGIELLAKVAELQPDSSVAQARLGAGKLISGDQSAGVARLESALALDPEFQQADMLLVLNHVQQGDYEKAIAAAEVYRRRHPLSTQPYNLLGRVYLAAGQVDNARSAFLSALELEPAEPSASHSLAQMAIGEGDYEQAGEYYDAVLAKNKNYLPTLIKLAEMAARQDDFDSMVAHLQHAIDQHPEQLSPRVFMARYYLRVNKAAQVERLFSDVDDKLKLHPQVLSVIAQAQLLTQDYSGARFRLEKLAELQPRSAQIHYQLAQAHAGLQNAAQLERELATALQISPDHVPSRLFLASYYLRQGKTGKAETQLVELRKQHADNAEVLKLEAAFAELQGEPQKALAFAEKAHQRAPSSATVFQLAGYLHKLGEIEREQKLLTQWMVDHPEDSRARIALANTSMLTQDSASADKHYREVLKRDEDNLIALNNLAWNLRESEPVQALVYAEKAVELAPTSAAAQDTLAIVLLNNGDLPRAGRAISRALEGDPADPSIRYHSALIRARAGEREAALEVLAPLLASKADFVELKDAQALLEELSGGG